MAVLLLGLLKAVPMPIVNAPGSVARKLPGSCCGGIGMDEDDGLAPILWNPPLHSARAAADYPFR
jgi:hypothetical protein